MKTEPEPVAEPDPYRGLCAATYDALVPPDAVGDLAFFQGLIENNGQPALEIGCGTGRLLLAYRAAGLEVEGVDLSAEMIGLCRAKAAEHELEVTLHQRPMQDLALERRYRLIFVPYFTFQLLTSDGDVDAALASFLAHLEPGGRVAIPLFFPHATDVGREPAIEGEWQLRREGNAADGTRVECWENAVYDHDLQIKRTTLRFDLVAPDGTVRDTEKRRLGIRWHTREQFERRLARAGFERIESRSGHGPLPAVDDDPSFVFVACKPADR